MKFEINEEDLDNLPTAKELKVLYFRTVFELCGKSVEKAAKKLKTTHQILYRYLRSHHVIEIGECGKVAKTNEEKLKAYDLRMKNNRDYQRDLYRAKKIGLTVKEYRARQTALIAAREGEQK